MLLHIRKQISSYRKRRIEKKEAEKILRACQTEEIKEVVVVYDLLVSPPTYGDFFYALMFARFFLLFKKKLNFWIIDSEFRQDALKAFSCKERSDFVEELLWISDLLLNKDKKSATSKKTWDEALSQLNNCKGLKYVYIPFEKIVLNRGPIYIYCFNVLNNLFNNLFKQNKKEEMENFFLSLKEILPNINVILPESPYITWQIRYSEKWGVNRNTTELEFLNIYNSLKKIYPDYEIMVISDMAGCDYFKNIAQKNNIKLLFSKDFSGSFIGDIALILNSRYFFSLRGGGIASVPVFSNIPYGFIAKPVHEVPFAKNRFAVWSTEKQVFVNSDKGMPEDVLSLSSINF